MYRFRKIIGKCCSIFPKNKLFYPFYLATQLDIRTLDYKSRFVSDALDGFSVCYASDIHYNRHFGKERLISLIEKINALHPDMVLLGGDYGDDVKSGSAFFEEIPSIHAKHGVFAAIGNHDLIGTKQDITQMLKQAEKRGIRFLINEKTRVGSLPLIISASDDSKYGKPDLQLLAPLGQSEDFLLYFPHSPDIMPHILKKGTERLFDLALCGHTHAGQIRIFGKTLKSSSKYGDRYRYSWKREENHDIFISSGIGTSIIPARLGTRPELYLFTLKKA